MLSKTQDDLAEMSLELGQTVRIFGFLQFAEKVDASMQKVPGFSNTEVLGAASQHRTTQLHHTTWARLASCRVTILQGESSFMTFLRLTHTIADDVGCNQPFKEVPRCPA
jgi:hypothetical protein